MPKVMGIIRRGKDEKEAGSEVRRVESDLKKKLVFQISTDFRCNLCNLCNFFKDA